MERWEHSGGNAINAYCLAALIKMFLTVYRAMIFLNAVAIVLNLTEPFLCSYIQNILTLSELLYSSDLNIYYCNITRDFSISRYIFFFCFWLHPVTLSYDINISVR